MTYQVYVKLRLRGKILINPSWNKLKIVLYLYLLINYMNVSFIHFHHVHYLFLMYVRHFLNHVVIFLALFGARFGPAP